MSAGRREREAKSWVRQKVRKRKEGRRGKESKGDLVVRGGAGDICKGLGVGNRDWREI